MKAGLLMVGDELTTGLVQDANASFIARELDLAGWTVSAVLILGDDASALKVGLDHLLSVSDAVIVAGGLGPTADDITTSAVAEAFGLPLEMNRPLLNRLKERFETFRIPWTENNAKQAIFPEGAVVIDNTAGTAAGFYLRREQKIVAVVPGVPREVQRMVPEGVMPVLEGSSIGGHQRKSRITLKILGLTEARVDEIVSQTGPSPDLSIGFYPNFPEIHLVIIAGGHSEAEAEYRLDKGTAIIRQAIGPYIYGTDEETLEGVAARLLTEQMKSLSVAESCTGGLITDRLTDFPGSSRFLERGIVAYSNEAKVELLGVPAEVIEKHGAVSQVTAELMAQGMRRLAGTDLGLSTTGIAGPSGGSEAKPVGTVYIALADSDRVYCRKLNLRWGRRGIKEISAGIALDMIRRYLTGGRVCDE